MNPWDFYFASLAGWLLHPGYQKDGTVKPSLSEIALLADRMLEFRNRRMAEEE